MCQLDIINSYLRYEHSVSLMDKPESIEEKCSRFLDEIQANQERLLQEYCEPVPTSGPRPRFKFRDEVVLCQETISKNPGAPDLFTDMVLKTGCGCIHLPKLDAKAYVLWTLQHVLGGLPFKDEYQFRLTEPMFTDPKNCIEVGEIYNAETGEMQELYTPKGRVLSYDSPTDCEMMLGILSKPFSRSLDKYLRTTRGCFPPHGGFGGNQHGTSVRGPIDDPTSAKIANPHIAAVEDETYQKAMSKIYGTEHNWNTVGGQRGSVLYPKSGIACFCHLDTTKEEMQNTAECMQATRSKMSRDADIVDFMKEVHKNIQVEFQGKIVVWGKGAKLRVILGTNTQVEKVLTLIEHEMPNQKPHTPKIGFDPKKSIGGRLERMAVDIEVPECSGNGGFLLLFNKHNVHGHGTNETENTIFAKYFGSRCNMHVPLTRAEIWQRIFMECHGIVPKKHPSGDETHMVPALWSVFVRHMLMFVHRVRPDLVAWIIKHKYRYQPNGEFGMSLDRNDYPMYDGEVEDWSRLIAKVKYYPCFPRTRRALEIDGFLHPDDELSADLLRLLSSVPGPSVVPSVAAQVSGEAANGRKRNASDFEKDQEPDSGKGKKADSGKGKEPHPDTIYIDD